MKYYERNGCDMMNNYSDEELINLCKEKSEDAYNELYKRYYPTAYKLAYHICKSNADARDAAQETMISVYQNISSLKQPQYFSLWLKRIVVGKCNRIFRKEKHIHYVEDHTVFMKNKKDEIRSHNPSKQVHFYQDKEIMDFFIQLLPPAQEQIMRMFYFEQLSIKEIAHTLQISEGTVKSRIFMARKKLKQSILEYEEREEISLDFQSEALFAMLGSSILGMRMPGKDLISSTFTSSAMRVFLVVVLGVGCIGAGNEIYQQYKRQEPTKEYLVLDQNTTTSSEEKQFQKVVLNDMEIDNAQDAYFKLLLKADTLEDISAVSEIEKNEIKALYASIKAYGGYYLNLLNEKGWNEIL